MQRPRKKAGRYGPALPGGNDGLPLYLQLSMESSAAVMPFSEKV